MKQENYEEAVEDALKTLRKQPQLFRTRINKVLRRNQEDLDLRLAEPLERLDRIARQR